MNTGRREAGRTSGVSWEKVVFMGPGFIASRCPRKTSFCFIAVGGLLLRREEVAEAAQGEVVAVDAKAGDNALADGGGL